MWHTETPERYSNKDGVGASGCVADIADLVLVLSVSGFLAVLNTSSSLEPAKYLNRYVRIKRSEIRLYDKGS